MRRGIITASVIAAAFLAAGFAEMGAWLPAIGCIGWELFVLYANVKRKPRAATRGKQEEYVELHPLYTYDTTIQHWTQESDQRWRA